MDKGNSDLTYCSSRLSGLLILSIFLLASAYSSASMGKAVSSGAPLAAHALNGFFTAQDKGPALSCHYCISPTDQSFTHEGGNGSITVSAPPTCSWTASTSDSFITLNSGTSGTGNGTLTYTLAANSGSTPRLASIAIAGHNFTVFQGIAFHDVPANHPFYTQIGKLSARAITLGCGSGNYCPGQAVTRQQMAAFIMRARGESNPPPPATQRFADVPPTNAFYHFIDRLAELGITLGCGTNAQGQPLYCPEQTVTREQMAAFLMRALGEPNPPVPATQRFADVGPTSVFYNFIDRLAVLGITLGCGMNGQGQPIFCPSDFVTREQMAAFLIRAFDQARNVPPAVNAGSDQAITLPSAAQLNATASDDGLPACGLAFLWSQVSGPGMVNFSDPGSQSTTASFSLPGTYVLRLQASDSQLSGTDEVTVMVNPVNPANQPPTVSAGIDQTVTLPSMGTLSGMVSDDGVPVGSLLTASWVKVSGPGTVIFGNASGATTTVIFSEEGSYVLRLTGSDGELTSSDELVVTVNADARPLPPDPVMVAPPVIGGVVTTLGAATEFLYSGANPIQTGVAPGTINPVRAAVLRGRVLNRGGAPLPLVRISVLNHPEFGQTLTRADGMFDMAVNGGGLLTLKYEKQGFIEVQRQERVSWQDYCPVPDVVMLGYDERVTHIDLSAAVPFQVAQGSPSSDSEGTRRAALLFAQGTTATMVLPDGTSQPLTNLHVRATEYTVGANGPAAMPGNLPPTSAYTYAVEYSVDEAVAAGARSVVFSQPVISYLENFLNFPVGGVVPVGGYDREAVSWMPSDNGRVVRILNITAGAAELDTDGDGAVDNGVNLGVTPAERLRLAELYSAGQSLWRMPINHFSPWDYNWPFGPPGDASAPPSSAPRPALPDDPCEQPGSIIECQNQTLGERIGITGTPLSLNYRSDRVVGRKTSYTLDIPLSAASVPASLRRIEMEISVAGRTFTQTFPAEPNQRTTFTWDGQDAYGRTLQGSQPISVRVGFVYGAVYQTPALFASSFGSYGESALTRNRTRQEITIWQQTTAKVSPWDGRMQALGGWTLSAHHYYDPVAQVLYLGDGRRRSTAGMPKTINTVAGGGPHCDTTQPCGDGGPATSASIRQRGIAVDGQGNLFIADTVKNRVRKVDPQGIITTVAGTGVSGFSGDGGPATSARLSGPNDVEVDAQGNLFIADNFNFRIRKVSPSGIITTVAGNGTFGDSGDNGPAIQAQFRFPQDLAVAPDGSLYIADFQSHRIRRISPDGIITTVAGGAPGGTDGIINPTAVEVDDEGNVFFAAGLVRKLSPDGSITIVAGGGNTQVDGIPATEALVQCIALALDRAGNLFIASSIFRRVRVVNTAGIITTVAGSGTVPPSRDGGQATLALVDPYDLAVDEQGNLLISDLDGTGGSVQRVRKVSSPLPTFTGAIAIASEDGSQLYNFDAVGRHLGTVNALTGATVYTFAYNSAGRLVSVTDGDGNVTTIERLANGDPTAIVAPFGQRTTLTLNANGYLASLANPAGETTQAGYTNDGLLTSFTDPRGNSSTMTYDALGRLERDVAPSTSGSLWNLTRTETANSFTVSLSSAMGRTTSYLVERLATGEERRVNTFPGGLQNQGTTGTNGSRTSTFPDGSSTTLTPGPDPRFGMQSPLGASVTTRMPSGLLYNRTHTRAVTLSNPNDPLSLATQTDTFNVNGRTYTSLYTTASRTFTTSTPVGRQTTTTIDTQGRITGLQFANLNPASFTYDVPGRLSTSVLGTASQARSLGFGYNSDGYLASITDPLNRLQSFSYDPAGRVTQQTLPGNRQISYSYDANSNLTSITPPGRPAHSFVYTPLNLLSSYSPPNVGAGTNQTLYIYNSDRQLTGITRPDSLTLSLTYDGAGRLSTLTIPGGQYLYTYNATTGDLESITAPGNNLTYSYDGSLFTGTTWTGTISGSVNHTYDNNFRVTSQSVNGGNPINFLYDNDNLLTNAGSLTLTRNAQNGLLTGTALSNITDTRGYNDFAEPMNYSAAFSGTGIYSVQHNSRDNLGRITQKTETIGGLTDTYTYNYDSQTGWLTQVQKNGLTVATYTYDSNGNRLTYTGAGSPVTGTYDDQDRLTQYGAATYAYSPNGELLSKTAGGQATAYQYDVVGNLKAVTLPDNTQIEYLVDGENRRIGKRVNGTLVQGFLYLNQLKPLAELDGGNNVVSRFIYGSKESVPDYLVKGAVTYRIISDHLGSVRLVVNVATGVIAQRMDYDEFGNVTMDTNAGFQPFGFAGGIYDPHTKLVRFGVRDYDAETGRWTAKDPILFAGETTNFYEYVSNDPINQTDSRGTGPDDTQITRSPFEPLKDYVKRRKEQLQARLVKAAGKASAASKDFAQGVAKGAKKIDGGVKCEVAFLEGLVNAMLKDLDCQSRGQQYNPNAGMCVQPSN
jgi:RHS repeat-associated protein